MTSRARSSSTLAGENVTRASRPTWATGFFFFRSTAHTLYLRVSFTDVPGVIRGPSYERTSNVRITSDLSPRDPGSGAADSRNGSSVVGRISAESLARGSLFFGGLG